MAILVHTKVTASCMILDFQRRFIIGIGSLVRNDEQNFGVTCGREGSTGAALR
jgi:hypothetical protein